MGSSGGRRVGGMDTIFPLSGYGLLAASDDPNGFLSNGTLGNNSMFASRVWIPASTAITSLWIAVRTAGTWDTTSTGNGLCLYDDSGNKVAATADDGTIWTTNGWRGGALVGGAQAAQATGRFVYVAALHRGMTVVPNVAMTINADDNHTVWYDKNVSASGNKRCFYLAAQTVFPASFNPTSAGTTTTFIPLVGVS